MARSNQTPAPAPADEPAIGTPEAAIIRREDMELTSDQEAKLDELLAAEPAAAEDAVVVTPVDHWWVAAEDFTVTVDWTTVTAKAGVSRFDPATGARLVALGVPLTPIES